MFSRAFRVLTIGGVDIRVAPSWLVIALVIVWSYQRAFTGDGRSLTTTVTMAVIATVLFTLSVLVHELAHALEGTHRGAEVGGITLFLLGGATALRDGDRTAADEFAIAAIGPWSNVVLAALFGLTAVWTGELGWAAVADVAGLLGWLNVGLAVFNLVPGAPLDGGRVLRAAIWRVTGNRNRATVVAAVVGLVLAVAMIGWSVWLLLQPDRGLLAGVWVGLIGAYVLRAARIELAQGRLRTWLATLEARELAPPLPHVAHDATEAQLSTLFAADDAPRVVALVRDDAPVGLRTADGDASATPFDELPVVAATGPADALAGLLDEEQPFVVLADDDRRWVSSMALITTELRRRRGGAT